MLPKRLVTLLLGSLFAAMVIGVGVYKVSADQEQVTSNVVRRQNLTTQVERHREQRRQHRAQT